jgi:hypothetical protein
MPQTPHIEGLFTACKTVRDVVIGMADKVIVNDLSNFPQARHAG